MHTIYMHTVGDYMHTIPSHSQERMQRPAICLYPAPPLDLGRHAPLDLQYELARLRLL